MTSPCRSIQERLARDGPTALQSDAPAQEHLVECAECYAFLEALSEVDVGLADLPPVDAPDDLVARTTAALAAEPPGGARRAPSGSTALPRRYRLSRVQALGSAVAAMLLLVTSWSVFSTSMRDVDFARTSSPVDSLSGLGQEPQGADEYEGGFAEDLGLADADPSELRSLPAKNAPQQALGNAQGAGAKGEAKDKKRNAPIPAPASPPAIVDNDGALSELAYRQSQSLNQRANEAFGYLGERAQGQRSAPDSERGAALLRGPEARSEAVRRQRRDKELPDSSAPNLVVGGQIATALVGDDRIAHESMRPAERDALMSGRAGEERTAAAGKPTPSSAQRFAEERRLRQNLPFQNTSGYWENTYVPGDPVMRWLQARLAKSDRGPLHAVSAGTPLKLESAARQATQAYDPPTTAALSVFLNADQRGVEGEERLLVQVGLRGADRHSRLRPSMNIGIVLDLRGDLPHESAIAMRALVHAFLDAKDVGDHFSLIAAGKPGATWVAAEDFRHGPITLALARLEGGGALPAPKAPTLGLQQAVQRAIEETKRGDDPNAPLGSSLVLLVSAGPLGGELATLEAMAHQSAVAGVPLSVVGVGDAISVDEIDRLALAGQGNRRLLEAPADAESLVARELSSLSRVIARALRLRIRLAPGVKLVGVIGSERLDNAGAARVRQAEKSIDRRLARNFGIEADRGEDEEGIQIVIPTFQSGDSHSVVLDVVAPGPGPIADVTVRYKDLVFLRNGVARANLTLGRDSASPGVLERNVVKSFLAIRLSETLKRAGQTLLAGQDAEAVALVRDFRELLAGLRQEVTGFQNDADLSADLSMLDEYLRVLGTGVLAQSEPRRTLADSLQLSGYFKTVPRSPTDAIHARADSRR